MEHRLHKRYPITLMVRLFILGQMITIAQADDICSEGIRIKNPGMKLNAGEKITVDFEKPGHPRPISYCASARVVYSNSKVIGLKFDNNLPEQAITNSVIMNVDESPKRKVS